VSILDVSQTPAVGLAVAGLDNRNRFDLVKDVSLEQDNLLQVNSSSNVVEEASPSGFFSNKEAFAGESRNSANFAKLNNKNSNFEAQEIAGKAPEVKIENNIKKGIAVVASAAETVGTNDALARLDQNGDGRIDQIEVKKGMRADEETSTFAALTQYQKSLELMQKLSEMEDLVPAKLFGASTTVVEKLHDGENFDKDLQSNSPQVQENYPGNITNLVA
jgi:hypothetical protein